MHGSESFVEIAGVRIPRYQQDPGWIPSTSLVLTPSTRRNLQKILYPLAQGYNLLLVGDAGVGKNALIYYINQERRHPTLRYSFNEDTLPEDLVGAYRIDPATHRFVWSDGPLAHAMRTGATFVADEMNLCPPEVLKRFYSVFTDRTLQLLEGDGEVIQAAPGFNFVATQNPAEGFEGRKNLPREIQKYFASVYVDPHPHDELVQILSGLYSEIDTGLVDAMVRINSSVERLVAERKVGGKDLERYHFNIRNLSRLCARIATADSSERQADLAGREIADIYIAPFRVPEDRAELRKTATEIVSRSEAAGGVELAGSEAESPEEAPEIHIDTQNERFAIGRAELLFREPGEENANKKPFAECVEDALYEFPPVPAVRRSLESILRGLELRENILLECEADVEPEDYVQFFAALKDKPLATITLSRGMHTGDVLGGLKPDPQAESDASAVRWVDGPLTAAVRRGDYILLKGLEAAGPELVEKLNMLLDDARALALPPEAGLAEPIRLTPDARIFGLKFFRQQRSTPSISRAFRNRFSAFVVPPVTDPQSLQEIAARRLQIMEEENESVQNLLNTMVQFHLTIRERSQKREIGAANLQPYQFGLTNLRRWCSQIRAGLDAGGPDASHLPQIGDGRGMHDVILRGAGVAYINELSDPTEREKMAKILENMLSGLPYDDLLRSLAKTGDSKKKIIKHRSEFRKIWWDQEKHWRPPNTGKFKPKLEGRNLKQGINIDTPETGGQLKEGEDAWYGSDTQGNLGQGEPGAGGGAWGYRTEELYKEFLKKRKPLWEYDMGVSLEDFKDTFGSEIQRVTFDFDRLLDPQVDISRRYMSQGSRVDARRYLSYIAGRSDGRVFDKTTVTVDEDKLKGVEIIFAVNKGRRIFNFEYSIATLVSIMSCAIILKNHELPFGVVGYSDLSNQKMDIDVQWFKRLEDDFDERREEELFYGLERGWGGDTVAEAQVLEELSTSFSPDARTRIIVMVSDFRGSRGKVTMQKDLESWETQQLYQTTHNLSSRGVIQLGVGVGARAVSEQVFPESLEVGRENFANMPALMAGRVTELVHKHHNAAVL